VFLKQESDVGEGVVFISFQKFMRIPGPFPEISFSSFFDGSRLILIFL
jgi:hypothetical protein